LGKKGKCKKQEGFNRDQEEDPEEQDAWAITGEDFVESGV